MKLNSPRSGDAGIQAILKATIGTAVASKAIKPAEFERIIVDSTVQEKAIAYPVDSRLLGLAEQFYFVCLVIFQCAVDGVDNGARR